jgi:hypothetical protein
VAAAAAAVIVFSWNLTVSVCVVFQIHWFSIFNSFMMVIFFFFFVSMILMRTLRKDYARYSKDEELDDMVRWTEICKYVCLPFTCNLWTWVAVLCHETTVDERLFAWIFGGLSEYDSGSKSENLFAEEDCFAIVSRLFCHSKQIVLP